MCSKSVKNYIRRIYNEESMIHKHKRTNIFLVDEELWAWAQYRAKTLGYESLSTYLFDLIRRDKAKAISKEKEKR